MAALLVGAVGAEDVSPFGHEAFVGQVEGASFAGEAVFVPGASLVVHHVHAFPETWSQRREGWKGGFHFCYLEWFSTCDGVLAAATLLRHGVLVTVDAEDLVLVFGEAHPCQGL